MPNMTASIICLYIVLNVIFSQEVDAKNSTSTLHNITENITESAVLIPEDGMPSCRLYTDDPYVYNKIQEILSFNVKLLEYELEFEGYDMNPLTVDTKRTYRGYKWARAYSQHGQTLLSLAFNYGIMSLMTLTLGVENLKISLKDSPHGCILSLSEDQKVASVLYLLMRDFQDKSVNITLKDQERICHEVILTRGNTAKFTDECCHVDPITKRLTCNTDIINIWLQILFLLLTSVKLGLLFFGLIYFIPLIESAVKQSIPYLVQLKDPLYKNVFVCQSNTFVNRTYRKVLDLRGKKGFYKFKESIKSIPLAETVKVKFTRYDILVDYGRLLVENDVPAGVLSSFKDAICKCRISEIGPFKTCCSSDILKSVYPVDKEITWLFVFTQIVKVLSVLLLPLPFYIRLALYYIFESNDIHSRNELLLSLDLKSSYDGGLMTHLSPTHPLYIIIYILYFGLFLVFIVLPSGKQKELKMILYDSFRDLKHMSWFDALGVFVGNMIWPFSRYGIIGCLLAPFYWLLIFPVSLMMYMVYCIPTFYIPVRMILHACRPNKGNRLSNRYVIEVSKDQSMSNFQTDVIFQKWKNSTSSSINNARDESKAKNSKFDIFVNVLLAVLCILTMFGMLLVLSECIGFAVEIIVFTLMGVIVNAGSVFKYVTLVMLVIVYSYDCYKNVGKKYLKLNKALFNELKQRCKDIEQVTSLPSHLQENFGFKSQELSEQADYELPDALDNCKPGHWLINDLVLFIDNEDMPRIPRKLFEEVCQINVAGAPGPVYQSLIKATKEFMKILMFIFFVFIVVLTFGTVYKVSSTNQMLATLAGGFLPYLMKTFLAPSKPNTELGTVSFRSKLDEIIKNFQQSWPIYDLPFEKYTEPEKEAEANQHGTNTDVEDGLQSDLLQQSNNRKYKWEVSSVQNIEKDSTTPKLQVSFDETILETNLDDVEVGMTDEQDAYDVDILIILPDEHGKSKQWIGQWSDSDLDSIMEYSLENSNEKQAQMYVSSMNDFI